MVEYLLEAKKFIEHARTAYSAEARNQDLDMAEWCITRAIEEAGHKRNNGEPDGSSDRQAELTCAPLIGRACPGHLNPPG